MGNRLTRAAGALTLATLLAGSSAGLAGATLVDGVNGGNPGVATDTIDVTYHGVRIFAVRNRNESCSVTRNFQAVDGGYHYITVNPDPTWAETGGPGDPNLIIYPNRPTWANWIGLPATGASIGYFVDGEHLALVDNLPDCGVPEPTTTTTAPPETTTTTAPAPTTTTQPEPTTTTTEPEPEPTTTTTEAPPASTSTTEAPPLATSTTLPVEVSTVPPSSAVPLSTAPVGVSPVAVYRSDGPVALGEDSQPRDGLAYTGTKTDDGLLALISAGLLSAGAGLVGLARRRRRLIGG